MEIATHLNSVNLWHITNDRPWRLILLWKISFSLPFLVSVCNVSKFWFSFFTSFDLGKDQVFLPRNKMIYGRNVLSPGTPFCCWSLLHSAFSHVSASLYPNLFDSEEKAYGIIPQSVLCVLAAKGTVGLEVKFLCQLGTCGSFLPLRTSSPEMSPCQVAANCNLLPAKTAGNGFEQRRFHPRAPQETFLQVHFSCR